MIVIVVVRVGGKAIRVGILSATYSHESFSKNQCCITTIFTLADQYLALISLRHQADLKISRTAVQVQLEL